MPTIHYLITLNASHWYESQFLVWLRRLERRTKANQMYGIILTSDISYALKNWMWKTAGFLYHEDSDILVVLDQLSCKDSFSSNQEISVTGN